ncbi:MAG: TlpA family protein disulfide reductase [Chloroflexi bacterium]|nr:TlpA family protein disulfide reductase [Chloroflexota bacterium]
MKDKTGRTLAILVAALAGVVALAACSSARQPVYPATPISPEAARGLAPDFQFIAYQGQNVLGGNQASLYSLLRKGKPVVLNMWAGECAPCRREMPDLQAVYDSYKGRFILFGLDVGPFTGLGSREEGKALLQELEITFPAGTTYDAEVVRDYEILGMPTTFFIKPNGEIVRKWTGLMDKGKFTELVESLLTSS